MFVKWPGLDKDKTVFMTIIIIISTAASNRTHVELFTLLPLCLNYLDVVKINCKSDTLTFLETHDEMLETQPILSMDIMTAKGKC